MSADKNAELAAAVDAMGGALPLPAGPQALPLAGPICTQAEARAAGLDIAPSVEELDAMASSIVAVGDPLSAEVSLAQAVPLLGAAVTGLRARIAELEAGIAWRDAERARWAGVHDLVERAIDKAWSIVDTFDLEDALGPEPAAEAQHAHNTAPGPDERPVNGFTAVFVPVASLREPEGEFHGALHHSYRLGHDMPETGAPSVSRSAPQFFQPGRLYAAGERFRFRCESVSTDPETGKPRAVGQHGKLRAADGAWLWAENGRTYDDWRGGCWVDITDEGGGA